MLEAPNDGSHGWFWRGRKDRPVTITLVMLGESPEIKGLT